MASKTVTYVDDDIDGTPATETIRFSVGPVAYVIDLSAANARTLRDALAPYVAAARRTSGRPRPLEKGRSRAERQELAVIRAWAREHGYAVNDRGRMSDEIHAAYRAATGDDPPAGTQPEHGHHEEHEEHEEPSYSRPYAP